MRLFLRRLFESAEIRVVDFFTHQRQLFHARVVHVEAPGGAAGSAGAERRRVSVYVYVCDV